MKKSQPDITEFIEDIEINGLKGRMLNAPALDMKASGVNLLFVHGSHSSIERLPGVAKLLRQYGNVCMPDLPGFGGMQPLYRIGVKPTVDNLADYLAAFIKLKYGRDKKFVILGFSLGFLVSTRMLQKYPDLQGRVILNISLAGFLHHDAFVFTPIRHRLYLLGSWFLGLRVSTWIAREIFFRKWFLGTAYTKTRNARAKFEGVSKEELSKLVDFEVKLWRCNDVRTHYFTTRQMLTSDVISGCTPLDVKTLHIAFSADQYFNNIIVEQHIKIAYKKVRVIHAKVEVHAPSVTAEAEDVGEFFPAQLRTALKELR